ncbi:RagB/SusD family nutrient uptake outer membrane protein [Plebeiibacterium marinum]|uniref:RagB/SusD family nutrient uptake outer membrane protein n=1 Tax=Plebeiibacterium marinum TaxID=2992111 RepID=A0AAE3MF28_9BACT|nr:RagB/SusD family nutrient uptake outer membrane protein [Plebeiobacterium marinum]MCW3806659.1 RagB/SusD family nutrient uptake outer membrane protein [Plebeiobacterium marinum]
MKKYIVKIFSVVALTGITFFSSCTELYDTSYNEILVDSFEPTTDDVPALVGSAYSSWRGLLMFWNGYWRVNEVGADQIVIPGRPNGWVDGGIYRRIHEHTWTTDDDNVYQTWDRTYSGISTCNRLLFQIESGFVPIEDEDVYSATIAELRALRASYYYVLCDLYGNVPVVTDFDVPEGYLPEQNTRAEVFEFIVTELKESIPYLNRERSSATYGRFNKWAAHTLLAKMYLNAEVYSGTPMWNECIDQCDSVINSGAGYELEANQKNVFITENQNSVEIIFGLAIDDQYTTAWNQFDIHMQTCQPSMQAKYDLSLTPWGGMCAIPQFINTFDPDDSRLSANFMKGQQYSSGGEELLVTMGNLVGDPLNLINEIPDISHSEEIHGYRFEKFEIALGSSNILNNDYPLFRYADILMMKAESMLRTGQEDEAAVLVTSVRERAFKSSPEKATVTGNELLQGSVYDYGLRTESANTSEGGDDIEYGRFLDELAWEFNQEGRRRQDMIRFGVYTTKSFFAHSPNGSYRSIYPIPRGRIETNSNLSQNPGY